MLGPFGAYRQARNYYRLVAVIQQLNFVFMTGIISIDMEPKAGKPYVGEDAAQVRMEAFIAYIARNIPEHDSRDLVEALSPSVDYSYILVWGDGQHAGIVGVMLPPKFQHYFKTGELPQLQTSR